MSFWPIIISFLVLTLGVCIWHSIKHRRTLVSNIDEARIFKSAFEHTAIGMAVARPNLKYISINKAFADIVGYTKEELLNMIHKDFTHPEDREKDTSYIQGILADKIDSFTSINRYIHKQGYIIWVRATVSAVRNEKRQLKFYVAQIQDITAAQKAEEELRKSRDEAEVLACTDYLTKTLNRGAFLGRLQEELERAKRYDESFAMILVDIDFFKKVNDQYGHLAGDYVLQRFAECLSTIVRPYDFIGRYGGEEFIICLPDTDTEQAASVAERMRKSIEDLEVEYMSSRIKVTGSFGVAYYDHNSSDTLDMLIEKADRAMYSAKTHKNTVYQWVS